MMVVDTVTPDRVELEFHLEAGWAAVDGLGGEVMVGEAANVTLITNPFSPDWGKAALHPSYHGAVSGKAGLEAEIGPKVAAGLSMKTGEFLGESQLATLESLEGPSVGGSLGIEVEVIAGGNTSVVGSIAPAPGGYWVDVGFDNSAHVTSGGGAAGEISLTGEYTLAPLYQVDVLPGWMRSLHDQFLQFIY